MTPRRATPYRTRMAPPSPRPAFELQGHRGARGLFPENTLEGFTAAIHLGVDALELDVAITRDGVPVVFHDMTLSPEIARDATGAWITGADIAIHRLTRAQLAGYDVGRLRPGGAYAARHPNQVALDGARIPDLEAVLRVAAAAGVRADIELKTSPERPDLTTAPEDMADRVMALVDHLGVAAGVDLRSFHWRSLLHLRRTHPELRLTWLTYPRTERDHARWWGTASPADPVAAVMAVADRAASPCWAPEAGGLTLQRVTAAREAGLRLVPWTVNDPAVMRRLMDWGVDGICTDRPDLARAVMRAAGLPLPLPLSRG